ncbi:hypothetical protein BgAZ_102900 [Babesia gibsoni]|uniref:Uncharacterized protein n=1 Tax=Babesia gibsoni TaxID=33632 RepID=A0AAD8PFG1_BABGI|nr:hypothetical protein BgAZ_102900 [Babesia gibsoni]
MEGSNLSFSVGMDPYCYKQFEDKRQTYIPCSKETFLDELRKRMQRNEARLEDGYAPFCKHIFVENFTGAKSGTMPITEDNRHLLKSAYVARTETELPVLTRWFPKAAVEDHIPEAKFLDVILYSKEQVIKEYDARGEHPTGTTYDFDYYVVSIKPQNVDTETPMIPITFFRNTMIDEGGSGVPIDHEKYMLAVKFWENHALIRDM